MPLTDDKAAALARAISENVPLFLLEEVLDEQGVVKDYVVLRKAAGERPDEALARGIVDAYNREGTAHVLAMALYRRGRRNDALAEAIAPFARAADDQDAAKEAAFALRAATLRMPELRRFLEGCEPRICVIAGRATVAGQIRTTSGTAFLVGPDLVLTARHVLRDHIVDGKGADPKQNDLCAFFDHLEGDPITDPRSNTITARRVPFNDPWLEHESDEVVFDGTLKLPDAAQVEKLKACLDVALVRLAEPIGLHARAKSGGTRRSWISLFTDGAPGHLAKDDRIIIPQHPQGHTLRVDFGRMKETDQSATRIRYDAETDKGTSGAPCFTSFDQDFQLVGVHNADYRPHGVPILNQAIRFDHISASILAKLKPEEVEKLRHPKDQAASRIWSVSSDRADPRVILGRTAFIDWIGRAAVEMPPLRTDRIYAAVAASPRAGRSFSLEILQAARRGTGEPIVVLGKEKKELIPESAPAFLAAVADQLRIPQSALDDLPARAAKDMPSGSKDGDKLNKWASEEVPRWFDKVLIQHRERIVDLREEARKIVDLFNKENLEPPADQVAMAKSPEPVPDPRNRWPVAWIVLDNLTKESLSKDVIDLIAGLCGDKAEERAVPAGLRRLRWLFLGDKPDFVVDQLACVEALDPMAFGIDSIIDCITGLAAAFDTELPDGERAGIERTLKALEKAKRYGALINDPLQRLETLQDQLNGQALVFMAEMEGSK